MHQCPWQDRVEAAGRADAFDAGVRDHVRQCDDCRSLAATIRVLRAEGRAAERAAIARVPSAQSLLVDARSGADRDVRLHRVIRPIVWLERVAALLLAVATTGAALWLVRRAGEHLAEGWLRRMTAFFEATTPVDFAGFSIFLAAVVVVAVAVYGMAGFSGTLRQN